MKNKIKLPDPKKAKRFFAKKLAFTMGPVGLSHAIKDDEVFVVDVRDAKSYAAGHIPGAVNLPKEQWHKPGMLKKNKANVVYCYSQTCHLATSAAYEFSDRGFPVLELEGGFEVWVDHKFPVQKGASAKSEKKAEKKVEAEPVAA